MAVYKENKRRKRIGLFVAYPELTHVRRVMEGIMMQCKKYDYDLCVFSSSVHFSFKYARYVQGEANIFKLANFDLLDGVIIDSIAMTGDKYDTSLIDKLNTYKDLPKCTLELPAEGLDLIQNDDEEALREQARHVIEVHNCKKICILTGHKGNNIAEMRLSVYLDEIRKHGLDVLPEHIVYGDFYYFSGDALAKKIISGEIEKPDAVICASDTMAIALIDRLHKANIKVPDDICVVSFDSSDEGAINITTIASAEPSDREMGAKAVDHLRKQIDPGAIIIPFKVSASAKFHPASSCGCHLNSAYVMKRFRNSVYISSYNMADEEIVDDVSLGTFMEGYVLEGFTASRSSDECIRNIYDYSDLLRPYNNFYLCLKENWQDMDDEIYEGYPEKMQVVMVRSRVGEEDFCGGPDVVSFDTKIMLPKLEEKRDKASVFYFSPVHFDGALLGFAVLQRELCDHPVINLIYRNWLRYVNNALEMSRSKERLQMLSVRDMMTGAFNRRGMYEEYRRIYNSASNEDSLFVCVADMDGLKFINDTYGHSEGDFGIKTVCDTLRSISKGNEICVRSGGDEFFLIGIGKYTPEEEAKRAKIFMDAVNEASKKSGKPYNISASIGCVVFEDCYSISLDDALSEADARMYRYKVKHRRHRSV